MSTNNHLSPWAKRTDAKYVEYILPEEASVMSLSSQEGPNVIRLEVTDELRREHTFDDDVSAIDLVDDPNEQIRRLGRVTFRRVK